MYRTVCCAKLREAAGSGKEKKKKLDADETQRAVASVVNESSSAFP